MKKTLTAISGFGAGLVIAFLCAFGTPDDTGPTFSDWTRTNRWAFGTNNQGAPPQITYLGSNFVGLTATINITNPIAGASNRLTFVNGILVGSNNLWSF